MRRAHRGPSTALLTAGELLVRPLDPKLALPSNKGEFVVVQSLLRAICMLGNGAVGEIRTPGLFITNEVLYP